MRVGLWADPPHRKFPRHSENVVGMDSTDGKYIVMTNQELWEQFQACWDGTCGNAMTEGELRSAIDQGKSLVTSGFNRPAVFADPAEPTMYDPNLKMCEVIEPLTSVLTSMPNYDLFLVLLPIICDCFKYYNDAPCGL